MPVFCSVQPHRPRCALVLKVRTKVKALSGCPTSKYTALIGGVWTPELLWSLSDGPRRFSALRRDIPAISEKVLPARLRDLEKRGVLGRNMMPTSPRLWSMS
jgi:DNA-binding HxlR family transcriptional regulator